MLTNSTGVNSYLRAGAVHVDVLMISYWSCVTVGVICSRLLL